MKVIIAGSRSITDFAVIAKVMQDAGFVHGEDHDYCDQISEVVSGTAPGVDTLGEEFAAYWRIPVKPFPAAWKDLTAPGAVVRRHKDGTPYNHHAGTQRNARMADYADAAVIIWDGVSRGSFNMMDQMAHRQKPHYVHNLLNGNGKWVRYEER